MLICENNRFRDMFLRLKSLEQKELLELALLDFKHLVSTVHYSEVSFAEFADKIEKAYDTQSNPRAAAVVRALREIHQINQAVVTVREFIRARGLQALRGQPIRAADGKILFIRESDLAAAIELWSKEPLRAYRHARFAGMTGNPTRLHVTEWIFPDDKVIGVAPEDLRYTVYVQPTLDRDGECRILLRSGAVADAKADFRKHREFWTDVGRMNAQGGLMYVHACAAVTESLKACEPLMAGMQYVV